MVVHNHYRAHGVAACSENVKRLKDRLLITTVRRVMKQYLSFFIILQLDVLFQTTPSNGSVEVVFTTIIETLVLLPVVRRLSKTLTF